MMHLSSRAKTWQCFKSPKDKQVIFHRMSLRPIVLFVLSNKSNVIQFLTMLSTLIPIAQGSCNVAISFFLLLLFPTMSSHSGGVALAYKPTVTAECRNWDSCMDRSEMKHAVQCKLCMHASCWYVFGSGHMHASQVCHQRGLSYMTQYKNTPAHRRKAHSARGALRFALSSQ